MKHTGLGCSLGLLLFFSGAPLHAALPDAVTFGVVIERGDVSAAKKWLEEGLNPDFIGDRIGTGLMIGAWEGNIEMMETFLAHGASISYTNRYNEQAIQLAAWKGQTKAVEWLISRGADINRTGREWNALHYAAFAGHTKLAKDLINRGADVNARIPNGSTVLMMAVREGHEDIVKELLNNGADPNAQNDAQDTALTWAMRYNNLRIAKLVSDQQGLAQAIQAPPESFGPAIKSQPVPDDVASLLKAIEEAELASLPTDELRRRFQIALEKHKQEKAAKPIPNRIPIGMEIRAKRRAAGQERVELIYAANPAKSATKTEAANFQKQQTIRVLPHSSP